MKLLINIIDIAFFLFSQDYLVESKMTVEKSLAGLEANKSTFQATQAKYQEELAESKKELKLVKKSLYVTCYFIRGVSIVVKNSWRHGWTT